jgi:DNA-binding NarL/FixJ family response regulator
MAESPQVRRRRLDDPPIRVLIANRGCLFRQVMKAATDSEPDIAVVAERGDAASAAAEAARCRADVVVLDVDHPDGEGVRAVSAIVDQVPACRVLALSDGLDDRLLLKVLQAGASGYLSKQAPLEALLSGIRVVHAGGLEIPTTLLRPLLTRLMDWRQEQQEAIRRIKRLSPREREVLQLVATGAGTAQIAGSLYVSPATVRTHIQKVLSKLELHSRVDVAAFVMRHEVLQNIEWML